jgi:hypothetical protein
LLGRIVQGSRIESRIVSPTLLMFSTKINVPDPNRVRRKLSAFRR